MSSIATKSLVNNHYPHNFPSYPNAGSKRLGGALGGGGSDYAAVAAYYEQNQHIFLQIHQALESGNWQSLGMTQAEIQQALDYESYCLSVLQGSSMGSGWGDPMGGFPQDPNMGQQPVPTGAIMGPYGNIVWDNVDVNLIHTDDPRPQDIWAENFSLDVSSMSAEVIVERTIDERTGQEITRITVKNNATGVETVYNLHGVQEATVRTGNEDQFTDKTNGAVTWEEYTGATEGDPSNLTDPKTMVDNILGSSGRNEGQLLQALKTAGYPFLTIEDLYEAIEKGEFPGEITGSNLRDLVGFLNQFDPTLNQLMKDASKSDEDRGAYRDYLISVLGLLYPNSIINANDVDGFVGFTIDDQQVNVSAFQGNVVVFLEEEKFDNLFGGLFGDNSDTTSDETPPTDEADAAPPPPADEPFDPAAVTMFGYLGAVVGFDYNSPNFAQALKDIYGDDALSCYIGEDNVLSPSEATRLVQDGILPPSVPDANFLKLLGAHDEELAGLIQQAKDSPLLGSQYHSQMRDRLIDLLDGIYGDAANVETVFTDDEKIRVNGGEFNFVNLLGL